MLCHTLSCGLILGIWQPVSSNQKGVSQEGWFQSHSFFRFLHYWGVVRRKRQEVSNKTSSITHPMAMSRTHWENSESLIQGFFDDHPMELIPFPITYILILTLLLYLFSSDFKKSYKQHLLCGSWSFYHFSSTRFSAHERKERRKEEASKTFPEILRVIAW